MMARRSHVRLAGAATMVGVAATYLAQYADGNSRFVTIQALPSQMS
jgi:hypothetical protein